VSWNCPIRAGRLAATPAWRVALCDLGHRLPGLSGGCANQSGRGPSGDMVATKQRAEAAVGDAFDGKGTTTKRDDGQNRD
jgi:hypothetical protein